MRLIFGRKAVPSELYDGEVRQDAKSPRTVMRGFCAQKSKTEVFGFGGKQKMMLEKRIGFLSILLIAVAGLLQNADAVVIDFEDGGLGNTYNVGDRFITSGVEVIGEEFQCPNETWYDRGRAAIQDYSLADGASKGVAINNIILNFNFNTNLEGLSLQYGEYGGNLNIQVNDTFVEFDNFADIDNSSVGGALIFTLDVGDAGQSTGAMFIVGRIEMFKIGGQELWIDNIIASPTPEPAMLTLLGRGVRNQPWLDDADL
ncbi:hypothetical protein ACFL1G_06785 [Planctomycetota bacterium]